MSTTNNKKQTLERNPPQQKKKARPSDEKWGREVTKLGVCIIPTLLLEGQARLGLNCTQLALLIHLSNYWRERSRKPYPTKRSLAERMRLSPRQVQRHLADLEKAGFLRREKRQGPSGAQRSNFYNLSGLVKKLGELAPDFERVRRQTREMQKNLVRPNQRLPRTRSG